MTTTVETIEYDKLPIDGQWVVPATSARILVQSASTEEYIGSVPDSSERDVNAAVAAARRAFDDPAGWAHWAPARRADVMERFAVALEARATETARRVSMQNGMPIGVALALEATSPAAWLRFYAGMIRSQDNEEFRPGIIGAGARVIRRPIGVVGAIIPWNVPQAIAFLKISPAMASGCTMVLKPSPETVLDTMLMAEAAIEAGVPQGVVNVVPGGREVGAYLVAHPGIDKVSFTGSTAAGRRIAETCGRLLRPVTLELGGKSAAIVLDDANLQDNLESFFAATLLNNGQICYLSTRILAPRSRYGEVVDLVSDLARSLTVGDALDPATQVGPLVSPRQRERVESYITKGRADGGRITVGGGRPGRDLGWFVEPTVFADVDNSDTIAREEIFGPVLAVIPYEGDDEAVALANDNAYGLGGTVWTTDIERGEAIARRVDTGTIGINGYNGDFNVPFGGVKASGLGREMGEEALRSYQWIKSLYLGPSRR